MSRGPKGHGELSTDSPVWGTSTGLRDDWVICEGDLIANLKNSLEFFLRGESAASFCTLPYLSRAGRCGYNQGMYISECSPSASLKFQVCPTPPVLFPGAGVPHTQHSPAALLELMDELSPQRGWLLIAWLWGQRGLCSRLHGSIIIGPVLDRTISCTTHGQQTETHPQSAREKDPFNYPGTLT